MDICARFVPTGTVSGPSGCDPWTRGGEANATGATGLLRVPSAGLVPAAAVNHRVAGSSPARGATSAPFKFGDRLLDGGPDRRAPAGASLFSRGVADLREVAASGRPLPRARWRVAGPARPAIGALRAAALGGESAERAGTRLTETAPRFTAGENRPEHANTTAPPPRVRNPAALLSFFAVAVERRARARCGTSENRCQPPRGGCVEQPERASRRWHERAT